MGLPSQGNWSTLFPEVIMDADASTVFCSETLGKYAEVLYWGLSRARKTPLKKSEVIQVRYDAAALPLAESVVSLLHDLGQVPVPRAALTPRMEHDFYAKANRKRLLFEVPGERAFLEALGGSIHLLAPDSLTHLRDVDPEAMSIAKSGRRPLQEILARREEQGVYGWTLCLFPTPRLARQAGMEPIDYARAVKAACFLDQGMPVHHWKMLVKDMEEVKAWLESLDARSLRVQSANVDLLLRPGSARRWVGVSGRNIPSFELYTSPDWRGTEGVYCADLPSFSQGHRIQGVRLEFRLGEVVRLEAEEGFEFAREQLNLDPGALRVGEFALIDKRFSPIDRVMANTLFDENFGGAHGSCHIALGQSYANAFAGDPGDLTAERKEELGFNSSALHWDLVNTEEKRVTAMLGDGSKVCIYENGQFQM